MHCLPLIKLSLLYDQALYMGSSVLDQQMNTTLQIDTIMEFYFRFSIEHVIFIFLFLSYNVYDFEVSWQVTRYSHLFIFYYLWIYHWFLV